MDNRAVSNTLGYVLLFAVVFMSITAAWTAGVQSLEAARGGALAVNAEDTMTSLASAVDDVHEENVSRTSRIRLGGGTIEPGEETTITVDIDDDGDNEVTQTTRSIVYRVGDTRIVYVAGAVFRLQNGGEVVVREPNYRSTSEVTILPIPATTSPNPGASVSGSTAQVFFTRKTGAGSFAWASSGSDGQITFETPSQRRAELWQEAVGDELGCTDPTSSTLECPFDSSSSVLVRATVTRFTMSV